MLYKVHYKTTRVNQSVQLQSIETLRDLTHTISTEVSGDRWCVIHQCSPLNSDAREEKLFFNSLTTSLLSTVSHCFQTRKLVPIDRVEHLRTQLSPTSHPELIGQLDEVISRLEPLDSASSSRRSSISSHVSLVSRVISFFWEVFHSTLNVVNGVWCCGLLRLLTPTTGLLP